jgi:glycosyltransferase involved in cell wall biosynthesis
MRIACIATSQIPSRRANSVRVMKVCQAFATLGHDVKLWVPGLDPKWPWEQLAEHYGLRERFPICWIPALKRLRHYDFCARAVLRARAWDSDVYYTWPPQAAALASRWGLATMMEVHDRPQGNFGPWLFRQFLRGKGARRVLPITNALRDWLERTYKIQLREPFAVVIRTGVDLSQYHDLPTPATARAAFGLKAIFTVGYTGHLYAGRGVELLLELARQNPSVQFIWAGGEPSAVELWRNRVERAGIGNIRILGFVPNERLPLLQAACEVLLMPYERRISVSSGGDTAAFASPMKLFEYMAAGRAIISSDLPVLREVLHEENAILVAPEDVEGWDEALRHLMADETLRAGLAAKARKEVVQYSWESRARRALEGIG